MKRVLAAAVGLAVVAAASAASAFTVDQPVDYSFSYTFNDGASYSGVLTGMFEGDGNTVDITGARSLSANGIKMSGPLTVYSSDYAEGEGPDALPVATLDKSLLDFRVVSNGQGVFETAVGDNTSADRDFGRPLIGYQHNSDEWISLENMNRSNYTAAIAPSSGGGGGPEPSTWALMMVGVFGAGAALRRRQGLALVAAA